MVSMNSCTSTKLLHTWKDPDTSIRSDGFSKVLVVALAPNNTTRMIAEDQVASNDPAFVSSYTIFPDFESVELNSAKNTLLERGFEGALTMQLVKVKETQTYVPTMTISSYSGWNDTYWHGYYQTGYYVSSYDYQIETCVYSLAKDKLLWAGITETVNQSDIQIVAQEILETAYTQMLKDGFIVRAEK